VVTDHLGTPRELLDEAGSLVWAAEYRVWGAVRRIWVAANDDEPEGTGSGSGGPGRGRSFYATGNLARAVAQDTEAARAEVEATLLCPIRFQGQWQDAETGLAYNRFRYYDALTAQYVSPDPMGIIAGVRSNAYVARPTVLVDVYGLIAWAPLGSGICIVQKFTAGSAEADELAQFVGEWNKEIIGRGGRMTGGSLTELQRNVQERWRKEFRQKNCCEPGQVAGHLPDAAAGGMPNPSLEKGLVQSGTTNRYLGGITGDLARRGQSYTHVYLRDSCG
jgi:RHS repeat-associated protein